MLRARRLAGIVASAGLAAGAADVRLAITQHGAWVSETRPVSLAEGRQAITLGPLPAEADLSALRLRIEHGEATLHAWRERRDGPLKTVEADLTATPKRRTTNLEYSYFVPGPTWSAYYQAVVRGDRVEEREPLSVDFAGWVRLDNPTARSFSNAEVRLIGRPPANAEAPAPGFLWVDESEPLTDLWRPPRPPREIEREYAMNRPETLPAQSKRTVVWVQSDRVPASRRYVLRAEDLTGAGTTEWVPLRKQIVVANTPQNQLGVALPPGPVHLFLGSLRARALPPAEIPHTPAGADLCMDLGPSDDVVGRRLTQPVQLLPEGGRVETYALEIENRREGGVAVVVDEKPPTIFEWSVLRSTRAPLEVFRRLHFEIEVAAGARERIEYSVRVQAPSF